MKKVIATVVASVVVIAIVGLPPLVGRQIEKHVDSSIAYINAQHRNISLEKVSLVRHWFSSDVVLKAHITEAMASAPTPAGYPDLVAANARTVNITLNSVIHHGPLMMGENVEGKKRLHLGFGYVHFNVFPKDIENINNSIDLNRLASLVKDQPLFTVTDLISFLGDDKINFKSASVHNSDDAGKIDWDGVYGKLWLNARNNKIKAEVSSAPISFEGHDGQKISTSEMMIKVAHHKDNNGLWVGESDASIPSLSISNKAGNKIDLKGAKFAVNTHSQKDLFEGDINASFTGLDHNDKTFGPLTLKATVDHFDAKALATIAQYHATNDQNYNAIASLVRQNQLLTAITQVLTNQPKVSVDEFTLKTPEGMVNLKGSLSLAEQTKQANGFLQLEPFIKSISLAFELTLPSPLAQKATIVAAGFYPVLLLSPEELANSNLIFTNQQLDDRAIQRLDKWADAKLVTKKENEYTISLKLNEGNLKLNDIPVSLTKPPLVEETAAPLQANPPAAANNAQPVQEVNPAAASNLTVTVQPAQPVNSDVPVAIPAAPAPAPVH